MTPVSESLSKSETTALPELTPETYIQGKINAQAELIARVSEQGALMQQGSTELRLARGANHIGDIERRETQRLRAFEQTLLDAKQGKYEDVTRLLQRDIRTETKEVDYAQDKLDQSYYDDPRYERLNNEITEGSELINAQHLDPSNWMQRAIGDYQKQMARTPRGGDMHLLNMTARERDDLLRQPGQEHKVKEAEVRITAMQENMLKERPFDDVYKALKQKVLDGKRIMQQGTSEERKKWIQTAVGDYEYNRDRTSRGIAMLDYKRAEARRKQLVDLLGKINPQEAQRLMRSVMNNE